MWHGNTGEQTWLWVWAFSFLSILLTGTPFNEWDETGWLECQHWFYHENIRVTGAASAPPTNWRRVYKLGKQPTNLESRGEEVFGDIVKGHCYVRAYKRNYWTVIKWVRSVAPESFLPWPRQREFYLYFSFLDFSNNNLTVLRNNLGASFKIPRAFCDLFQNTLLMKMNYSWDAFV